MKKPIVMVLVLGLIVSMLGGCGKDKETSTNVPTTQDEYVKDETPVVSDSPEETEAQIEETESVAEEGTEKASEMEEVIFEGPDNRAVQFFSVPEGTTKIADDAFEACVNLEEITLPDSLVNIGDRAFRDCKIKEVTLPENLEIIGNQAFYNTSLESIIIPASVKTIGEQAFMHTDDSLKTVSLSEGLETIGDGAFSSEFQLKEVVVPESVTSIGSRAFTYCQSLESATLPDGLEEISMSMFDNCVALRDLKFPSGVKSIMSNSFRNCVSLEEINLPAGLEQIGVGAFEVDNSDLSSYGLSHIPESRIITIPDSVTKIDSSAFTYRRGEQTIRIPQKVLDTLGMREDGFINTYCEGTPTTIEIY